VLEGGAHARHYRPRAQLRFARRFRSSFELLVVAQCGTHKKVPVAFPTAVPLLVILAALFFAGEATIEVLNPPPLPPAPRRLSCQDYSRRGGEPWLLRLRLRSYLRLSSCSFGGQGSNFSGWQFETKASCHGHTPMRCHLHGRAARSRNSMRARPLNSPRVFNPDGWHLTTRVAPSHRAERVALADSKFWPTPTCADQALQTDPQKRSTKPRHAL